MSQIKTIISDADGTLVNTLYLIRHGQYEASVKYLLDRGIAHSNIPGYLVYEKYLNQSVGGNVRETGMSTFNLLLTESQKAELGEIDFAEWEAHLTHFQDHLAPLYVHPYQGLTEFFTWAGLHAVNMGIFTSGSKRMILRNFGVSLPELGCSKLYLADTINIDERLKTFTTKIKTIYGISEISFVTCDDVSRTKPDPEGILQLLKRFKVQTNEVIALGDHPMDMLAAKRAGVRAFGVSHGFATENELLRAGADRVVHTLNEVSKLVDRHNGGKILF